MTSIQQLSYQMPAEWQRHRATWLAWPKRRSAWSVDLQAVEEVFYQIALQLHHEEEVRILVCDGIEEKRVLEGARRRGISKNVFLHRISTKSVWIRDYGPIFVRRHCEKAVRPTKQSQGSQIASALHGSLPRNDAGRQKALKNTCGLVVAAWKFNAWGGKYRNLFADGRVPGKIASLRKMKVMRPGMVLEGGSIDVNGAGACLTTSECLLNPNRNPKLTQVRIEENLFRFLGARHVIWLAGGIRGDDTDGHVDCAARFTDSKTVVAVRDRRKESADGESLEANWNILKTATDQNGKKLNLAALPVPGRVNIGCRRLPASYANFYIGNKSVLVPVFGTGNDARALGILRELFPNRRVVGIRANALVSGLGGIHCATMQEPV